MKIYSTFFIIFFTMSVNVFASGVLTLKAKSFLDEKLLANVLIDISDIDFTGLTLGEKMDYKLLKLNQPEFLNTIYIELTNIKEDGKRKAYIKSNEVISQENFVIILKLFSDKKPKIFSFEVHLKKRNKEDYESDLAKRKVKFLFTPFYRTVSRDIKLSQSKVSSNVRLLITRFQYKISDSLSFFGDVGYGLFQIEDSVPFSSLPVPVNLDKFDGGRSLAYGGGLNVGLFKVKNLDFSLLLNYTRFESESSSNALKLLNSRAVTVWSEYGTALGLTYNFNKFFSPKVAVSYSKIDGSFKMIQKISQIPEPNETKNIDEDNSLGVVVGFIARPVKELSVNFSSELVNQTGFKLGLTLYFY